MRYKASKHRVELNEEEIAEVDNLRYKALKGLEEDKAKGILDGQSRGN